MAEPLKMIHLSPAQIKRKKFNHPLIDDAPPPLTEEQLNQLLLIYFETRDNEIGKNLTTNYLRLLRSVVARYLYHWPVSRRFLNEMVSAGAEGITKIIAKLKQSEGENLTYRIEGRIRFEIESILNKLRGIVPASRTTNHRREQIRKKPFYGSVVTSLDKVRDLKKYNDLYIFEIKDAIENIAQTKLEKQILMQDNWGLSNKELSIKLNSSSQYIGKVRSRLRKRYQELGEKSQEEKHVTST